MIFARPWESTLLQISLVIWFFFIFLFFLFIPVFQEIDFCLRMLLCGLPPYLRLKFYTVYAEDNIFLLDFVLYLCLSPCTLSLFSMLICLLPIIKSSV
jgi:hypothetical protein